VKILVAKQGEHQPNREKNSDFTESVNWAQDGVKIMYGGILFTFRENEHDRVCFVREV